MTGPARTPARRMLALLVAASAAFTVYGSLVPFTLRAQPPDDPGSAFRRAMTSRAAIDSRSDALANVLLGVPLGFGLLGLCRVGTPNRAGDVAAGAALLPVCVAFAAAVEFAQLYTTDRQCTGSDVLCQGVGAAVGMAVWVAAGRRLVGHAADLWVGAASPGRVLVAYLVLLAFVQALPLDLSASPKDWYKKARDHVEFVPFRRLAEAEGDRVLELAAKVLKVVGLYLPAGLLAARLPGRFWEGRNVLGVAAAGVAVAAALEGIQLLVTSRVPAATDVVVGAAGATAGWAIGRRVRGAGAAVWGVLWAGALLVAYWHPFDFRGPGQGFGWVPGGPLESGHPLFALEELLTKVILFGLLGVAVAAGGTRPLALAATVGTAVAAVIEGGQVFLPRHTPCITDVLVGGAGALAGAWVAGRLTGSPPVSTRRVT